MREMFFYDPGAFDEILDELRALESRINPLTTDALRLRLRQAIRTIASGGPRSTPHAV